MKTKVILMLALLASCSKDYIEEEVVFNTTPIKQEFQEVVVTSSQVQSPVLFQSKAPSYPGVNNTVGSIRKQYFFPGFNHIETLYGFRSNMKNSAFLDFDQNGQLDLFSVLVSQGQGSAYAGDCSTKIKIVKNIFTNEKEEFIYQAPYNFGLSDLHINDFNGDGIDEVIIGSFNKHDCSSYSGVIQGVELPIHIYYINSDGTFTIDNVTPPTSLHDLTTGDIDNDGDIDIVYVSQFDSTGKPYTYLNNGNGEFISSDNFFNYNNEYVHNLAINLFDLNNDDILDIVMMNKNNSSLNKVVWGLGDGLFDLQNYFYLQASSMDSVSELISDFIYLGISFFDYDNNGYSDIIVNGALDYKGEFIFIYKNNGNQTFVDSSTVVLDSFYSYHGQHGGPNSMGEGNPQYRTVVMFDKDNDGDFDLVPSESEWDYITGPWNRDFFFENKVGSFVRVYE